LVQMCKTPRKNSGSASPAQNQGEIKLAFLSGKWMGDTFLDSHVCLSSMGRTQYSRTARPSKPPRHRNGVEPLSVRVEKVGILDPKSQCTVTGVEPQPFLKWITLEVPQALLSSFEAYWPPAQA